MDAESTDFIAEFKLDMISFSGSASFSYRAHDESDAYAGEPIAWGYYPDRGNFLDGGLTAGVRLFRVVLDSSGWDTNSRTPSASSWADWRSEDWGGSQDALKPVLWHNCGTTGYSASLHQRWYYYFHRQYVDPEPSVTAGAEVELSLATGWNMVSVPLELAEGEDTIAAVFQGEIVAIYTWDPVAKSYTVPK